MYNYEAIEWGIRKRMNNNEKRHFWWNCTFRDNYVKVVSMKYNKEFLTWYMRTNIALLYQLLYIHRILKLCIKNTLVQRWVSGRCWSVFLSTGGVVVKICHFVAHLLNECPKSGDVTQLLYILQAAVYFTYQHFAALYKFYILLMRDQLSWNELRGWKVPIFKEDPKKGCLI